MYNTFDSKEPILTNRSLPWFIIFEVSRLAYASAIRNSSHIVGANVVMSE